jgi:ATP-dependent Clp protease ATP-binding subunit ClpA
MRARDEARAGHAPLIGTEHLLLALLDERAPHAYPVLHAAGFAHEGVQAEVARRAGPSARLLDDEDAAALRTIGIDLDAVLASITESFGPDALTPPPPRRPGLFFGRGESSARRFTPNARKTMGLALREAIRLGDNHIDDGHILLGLIRGGGQGASILSAGTVPLDSLRTALEAARRPAA